jgi:hypothetical protein
MGFTGAATAWAKSRYSLVAANSIRSERSSAIDENKAFRGSQAVDALGGARQAEGGRVLLADANRELRRARFSADGRAAAVAVPVDLESPLGRIPELTGIFLHKAETGLMILSDDKLAD